MKEQITSKDNSIVKLAKSLFDKKFRKRLGLFLLEGHKLIDEAINSNETFEAVFIDANKLEEYEYYLNTLACRVIFTNEQILKYLSPTESPQGILALVKTKEEVIDSNFSGNFLILDRLQDPGNLGAIIRTAAATNFTTIFMLDCVDVYNEKVVRASMGNLFKTKNITTTLDELKQVLNGKSYELYLADMNGETVFRMKKTDKKQIGIIIGNEGSGVREELYQLNTKTVSIPMQNEVESLNAAVSASILMYEFIK